MRKYTIEIQDKEYDLAMTRESVKWVNNNGFDLINFENKLINNVDILWCAGFLANHKDVRPSLALKLMESYKEEGGDIMDVVNFLMEEHTSFTNALVSTDLKKKGKITIA